MMRRLFLTVTFLTGFLISAVAQKISVERLKKVSVDPLNMKSLPVDKKQATLDLLTDEKGFTFKAVGQTEVKAEEGEGKLTLLVPNKTTILLIKHPDYGQFTWKVPGKGLRKKKHYQANLLTDKPGKEYKLSKQWVVFQVTPVNAIIEVDTVMKLLRDGVAQFNVNVGKHPYKVYAPFHEVVEDTLEVTDSVKLVIPVALQSFYSYITVRTPVSNCDIYLDGQPIGKGEATSGHLDVGNHRLQVFRKGACYYDALIPLQKAEKKVLTLTAKDLSERKQVFRMAVPTVVDTAEARDTTATVDSVALGMQSKLMAKVTITAPDDSTEIWINREPVATGKWEGQLELGYYTVNTKKDGLESKTIPFWVDDTLPQVLDMSAPLASYGLLNIHSNVIGAVVKVNGLEVGVTPCVVENLPALKSCKVSLAKKGYVPKEVIVTPMPNDMLDVELKMIKR